MANWYDDPNALPLEPEATLPATVNPNPLLSAYQRGLAGLNPDGTPVAPSPALPGVMAGDAGMGSSLSGLNQYLAQKPEKLSPEAQARANERFKSRAAIQPPKKAIEAPLIWGTDTLAAAKDWVGGLGTTVPAALYRLKEGDTRPDQYSPEAKAAFAAEEQLQQQSEAERLRREQAGESTQLGSAIREAIPSSGFSVGSMAAAIPAGLATGAATQAAIPVPGSGFVGGVIGSFAGSGATAFQMARSTAMDEWFKQAEAGSLAKNKRPLTEPEKQQLYEELQPLATDSGLWEAGPEALGNAFMLVGGGLATGLIGKAAFRKATMGAMKKAGIRAGAAAVGAGMEFGTETTTELGQATADARAEVIKNAIAEGRPIDPKEVDAAVSRYNQLGGAGVVQAFKDIAAPTLGTMVMFGLAGGAVKGGQKAYKRLVTNPQDAKAILEMASSPEVLSAMPESSLRNLESMTGHLQKKWFQGDESRAALEQVKGNLNAELASRSGESADLKDVRQQTLRELWEKMAPPQQQGILAFLGNEGPGLTGYLETPTDVNAPLADKEGKALGDIDVRGLRKLAPLLGLKGAILQQRQWYSDNAQPDLAADTFTDDQGVLWERDLATNQWTPAKTKAAPLTGLGGVPSAPPTPPAVPVDELEELGFGPANPPGTPPALPTPPAELPPSGIADPQALGQSMLDAALAQQQAEKAAAESPTPLPTPTPGETIQLQRGESIELTPPKPGEPVTRTTVTPEEQARLQGFMGERPTRTAPVAEPPGLSSIPKTEPPPPVKVGNQEVAPVADGTLQGLDLLREQARQVAQHNTPADRAADLLGQIPGRIGEQQRIAQEGLKPRTPIEATPEATPVPLIPTPTQEAPSAQPSKKPVWEGKSKEELESSLQMYDDAFEIKKRKKEEIPQEWIGNYGAIKQVLRGEEPQEGLSPLIVPGHPEHPLTNTSPLFRYGTVPLKVTSLEQVNKRLSEANEAVSSASESYYSAKYQLDSAKTAAEKKKANQAIQDLANQGITEDAILAFRNETIPELNRLYREMERRTPSPTGVDSNAQEVQAQTEAPITPVEKPFGDVDVADEGRYFGTRVQVAADPKRGQDAHTGTVQRVLNGGTLLEIKPDGVDSSFRVPGYQVTRMDAAQEATGEAAPVVSATEEAPATATKEPWQMTRDEFLADLAAKSRQRQEELYAEGLQILEDIKRPMTPQQRQALEKRYQRVADAQNLDVATSGFTEDEILIHQQWIQGALRKGKPVPPEVLADYPDLAKQAEVAPTPATTSIPVDRTPEADPFAPATPEERQVTQRREKLADPDFQKAMIDYRDRIGWAVVGERLFADGKYIGSTSYVPHPDNPWWAESKGLRQAKGLSEAKVRAALTRFNQGEAPESAAETALLDFLIDYDQYRQSMQQESAWIEDQLTPQETDLLNRLTAELENHPAFGSDKLAEFLERISQKYETLTPAQFDRALILTYEAKLDALRKAQSSGRTERATEGSPRPAGESDGAPASETPLLASYTLAELDAENARVQAELEKQRQADAAADAKRQADKDVGGFTLSGSDRPADIAASAGQKDLLAEAKEAPKSDTVDLAEKAALRHKEMLNTLEKLGWEREGETGAKLAVGGGTTGGELNPTGKRTVHFEIAGGQLRAYFQDGMEKTVTVATVDNAENIAPQVLARKLHDQVMEKTVPAPQPEAQKQPEKAPIAQPTPAAEEKAAPLSGFVDLANRVKVLLLSGSVAPLTSPALFRMADAAFGGTQAQGTYNSKDAYDAMELGVNLALLEQPMNWGFQQANSDALKSALTYLEALQQRLPTQSKRDEEQIAMQQFSTPHIHAHVVAWVANIAPTDVVLEPTAGTGNLVTHAQLAQPQQVIANELSERRSALLKEIPGVRTFTENANHLNAILPADVKPTVVVMNPPFSADINKVGKKDLMVAAKQIEQALARLQPNGRLVAIVGRGMSFDAETFKDWWNTIQKQYRVRANIAISGKEYTKFGTSFDNRILVIDKTGQTGLRSTIVEGDVAKVADLIPLLEAIRRERVHQATPAGQSQPTSVASPQGATRPGSVPAPGVNDQGDGTGTVGGTVRDAPVATRRSDGRADAAGEVSAPRDTAISDGKPGEPRTVRAASGERDGSDGTQGVGAIPAVDAAGQPAGIGDYAQPAEPVLEIEKRQAPAKENAALSDKTFEGYQPEATIKGAKPHPTPLVESAAMAAVRFPPLQYVPNLPMDVVESGALSAAQLEAIAYAGQAHTQLLPNGERRGYFIGDGCVAAETRIFDPVTGRHTPIKELAEQGSPIHVLALTQEGFVITSATAPFLKGSAELYKVALESGKSVIVTGHHRFLTPQGWRRIDQGLSVHDAVASVENAPSHDILVDRNVLPENERSYFGISPDFQGNYPAYCRLDDEQPRETKEDAPVFPPLLAGVHERNHKELNSDGLAFSIKHNHPYPDNDLPSKTRSFPSSSRAPLLIEDQGRALFAQWLAKKRPELQQFLDPKALRRPASPAIYPHPPAHVADLSPTEIAEESLAVLEDKPQLAQSPHARQPIVEATALFGTAPQWILPKIAVSDSVSFSFGYYSKWDRIVNISFVRWDYFYDLYVPGPENYVAEGIVHHNTGVGKGAEIAGVIVDNWRNGRKKAVWVSENGRLFPSAQRDADWVGLGKEHLFQQGAIKGEIQNKEGVLYTTYATLRNAEKGDATRPGLTRLDQLVNWLGKDFDGVIAFDEAHNMGNATDSIGSRGRKEASAAALAGIELQKRLPKARVIYVSATGATEVDNLVYAQRLGLWGEGTAFADAGAFVNEISSGGLAAMEVVAKDMKSFGLYTARSLSWDGVVVEPLQHSLSPEQAQMYDELARSWQVVLQDIGAAMKDSGSDKNGMAKGQAMGAFWGAHQRFFNAILTSLSVPSLIQDVETQIAAGHSVVMQLVNTNEATQERRKAQAADAGLDLSEVDITPRDILMQYLQNSFPTALYEDYTDDNGNVRSRPVTDSAGNVVQNPSAVARRDALMEKLGALSVPEGVLEQVINHFGSKAVAEITGRKSRLVRQPDGKVIEEKLSPAKSNADASAFDNDDKRILVFSDAGGTGRSYHADRRFKNQRLRVHYLVQPGWRADKAIQGLGRTHRTNQAQPPLIKTVTTNIKSQLRFVSSIARRMDQMGALTKGQRDANSQGMFEDDMNLENRYSEHALETLFLDIRAGRVDGVTLQDIENQMGLRLVDNNGNFLADKIPTIQQFLNRLLSLDLEMMERVFDAFDLRRKANIEYAKQNGNYDAGMETLKALSIIQEEEKEVARHPGGGTTQYVKLVAEHENRFIGYDVLAKTAIFARNRQSGKLYAFEPAISITNPKTGEMIERSRRFSPYSAEYKKASEVYDANKYEILEGSDAKKRKAWEQAIKDSPQTSKETIHLITGALLPVWDRLDNASNRVIRAQTDQGKVLIGRQVKGTDIAAVLKKLGVQSDAPQLTAQQALDVVMQKGATLILSNGWKIERRTVNNQPRIELVGANNLADVNLLKTMGAFAEVIQFKTRVFLPTDRADILERIIKSKPIIEVLDKQGAPITLPKPQASLTPTPAPGLTRTGFIAALQRRFPHLSEALDTMLARGEKNQKGGLVLINSNDLDTIARVFAEKTGRAQDTAVQELRSDNTLNGLYDPTTGLVFAILPNLSEASAPGVFLHENVHAQQRADIDARAVELVNSRSQVKRPELRTLLNRVQARLEASSATNDPKEVSAYLIEELAATARLNGMSAADGKFLDWADRTLGQPVGDWVRSIVKALRGWAFRHGFLLKASQLSLDDLLAWAEAGVQRTAQGDVELSTAGAMARGEQPGATFYSALARAIQNLSQKKAPGSQWASILENLAKKGQVKQEELDWTGTLDWLREQKTLVPKEDVLNFVRSNEVQVEETELGKAFSDQMEKLGQWKFDKHNDKISMWTWTRTGLERPFVSLLSFDGGKSWGMHGSAYTVIPQSVLKATYKSVDAAKAAVMPSIAGFYQPNIETRNTEWTFDETADSGSQRELILTVPTIEPWNTDDKTHYGDVGGGRAVAWVRFNTRTDEDGKQVLFIEEIQSKRHQEGREKGYKKKNKDYIAIKKLRNQREIESRNRGAISTAEYELFKDFQNEKIDMDSFFEKDEELKSRAIESDKALRIIDDEIESIESQYEEGIVDEYVPGEIPDAPFKSTIAGSSSTLSGWAGLAFKRMLRYAAENGYERMAWTTGEQQALRYNLGQKVSRIDYVEASQHLRVLDRNGMVALEDNIPKEKLPEYLGNELTKQLFKEESKRSYKGVFTGSYRLDFPEGAVIGGEGMRGFYDRLLPNEVNKYVKKWGAQVGQTAINTGTTVEPVHSVEITPDMVASVMKGQPLFSRTLTADELLAQVQSGQVDALTPDQWAQVQQAFLQQSTEAVAPTGIQAPSFKSWFGASRIKTKAGQPLKMYHATDAEFSVFDPAQSGQSTTHPTAALGFFFTNDRDHAEAQYGNNVMEVYLAIENPYPMTDADLRKIDTLEDAKAFRQKLEAQGYDGIVMPAETRTRYVAAFHADQIKRTDNATYTKGEKDIRFSQPQAPAKVGVSAAAITQSLIQPKLAAWNEAGLSVEVVQSVADLPADLQKAISPTALDVLESSVNEVSNRSFPKPHARGNLQTGVPVGDQLNSGINIPIRSTGIFGLVSNALQIFKSSGRANTKAGGNIFDSNSLIGELFDSLSVDRQLEVMNIMRSSLHNFEVFRSIVSSIPVDMMNDLSGIQLSSQLNHRDHTMFQDGFSAKINVPVFSGDIRLTKILLFSAFNSVAGNTAKFPVDGHAFSDGKISSTSSANHGYRHDYSSMLSFPIIAKNNVEGFYDVKSSQVYLVADNLASLDRAKEVLSHEVIGHWASHNLRAAPEFVQILKALNRLEAVGNKDIVAIAAQVDAAQPGLDRFDRAEEIYSVAIERGLHEKIGLLRTWSLKLLQRVKAWLRKLGFEGRFVNDITLNDVLLWAQESQRRLDQGGRGTDGKWAFTGSRGISTSFAGEKAQTADLSLLQQAKLRVEQGEDAETVRKETGWFKGLDNRWKFEIDDSKINLADGYGDLFEKKTKQSTTLDGFISHPDLFDAYPDLRNIKVILASRTKLGEASYNPESKTITLGVDVTNKNKNQYVYEEVLKSIIHEVQHAIQSIEGFAIGTSPEKTEITAEDVRKIGAELSVSILGLERNKYRELNQYLRDLGYRYQPTLLNSGTVSETSMDMVDGIILFASEQGMLNIVETAERWEGAALNSKRSPEEQKAIEKKAFKDYLSNAGEIEARATTDRLNWNIKHRQLYKPYEDTQFRDGIADEDVIVRFEGGTADLRYSRALPASQYEDTQGVVQDSQAFTPISGRAELKEQRDIVRRLREDGFWKTVKTVAKETRPAWLKLLTLQQKVEMLQDIQALKDLATLFENTALAMDADKSNLKQEAFALAEEMRSEMVKARDKGYLLGRILQWSSLKNVVPYQAPERIFFATTAEFVEATENYQRLMEMVEKLKTDHPALLALYDKIMGKGTLDANGQRQPNMIERMDGLYRTALQERLGRQALMFLNTTLESAQDSRAQTLWQQLHGLAQRNPAAFTDLQQTYQAFLAVTEPTPAQLAAWRDSLPPDSAVLWDELLIRDGRMRNRRSQQMIRDMIADAINPDKTPRSGTLTAALRTLHDQDVNAYKELRDALKLRLDFYRPTDDRHAEIKNRLPHSVQALFEQITTANNAAIARLSLNNKLEATKTTAPAQEKSLTGRLHTLFLQSPERFAELSQALRTRLQTPEMDAAEVDALRSRLLEPADQALFDELAADMRAKVQPGLTALRELYESRRQSGPYFPLDRFGPYQVYAERAGNGKDGIGLPAFSTFETEAEQQRAVQRMQAEGWTVRTNYQIREALETTAPPNSFIKKMFNQIDQTEMLEAERQTLKNDIYQMYLQSLPELSARKHFMKRKGIPGFSGDALRSFAQLMNSKANAIARLRHSDQLTNALESMEKASKAMGQDPANLADQNRARMIVEELKDSYSWMMNPSNATWANRLTSLGFFWYLTNISTALVNLTQVPIWTFPELGAKFGAGRSFAALNKTIAEYGVWKLRRGETGRKLLERMRGEFNGELGLDLDRIERDGIVTRTQAVTLAGMGEDAPEFKGGAAGSASAGWKWVFDRVSWPFHKTEVANREISFITAYRLARTSEQAQAMVAKMTAGGSAPDAINDAVRNYAYETARNVVLKTQGNYANYNRAPFMRNNIMRVITLFRSYSQMMTWRMLRDTYQAFKVANPQEKAEVRKRLGLMLASSFLWGGAMGLPIYTVAMSLAGLLFGNDPDDPYEPEVAMKQALQGLLGETGQQALMGGAVGPLPKLANLIPGIDGVTGIDLAPRVSADLVRLWMRRMPGDLEGESAWDWYVMQMMGPIAGMGRNAFRAYGDLVSSAQGGGSLFRALEGTMPAPVRNILKAARFEEEGVTTRRGDLLVPDMNWAMVVQQAVGFTPDTVAAQYAQNTARYEFKDALQKRRKGLTDRYIFSLHEKDDELRKETLEFVKKFNRLNPETPITAQTLKSAYGQWLRARQLSEGGVYEPSKGMRARLKREFAEEESEE